MSVKQYRWISPVRTLILLWVIVLTGTRLAPERLLYATWGNSRLLSQSGAIALIGCIGFFIMGAISYDFMIKKQRRLLFQYRVPSLGEIKVGLNLISWGTWLILPILIYWLYITFRDLGGIGAWSRVFEGTRLPGGVRSLFELNEPLGGSETLVTTLTALLICCAGYKGYLRANNHINFKAINKRASFLLAILFALLLCYVLFSSTRVFFVTGVLSAFAAFAITSGEEVTPFSKRFLLILLILGGFWVITQASAYNDLLQLNPIESLQFSLERLFFYFAINVRNFDTTINYIRAHTWGASTFWGVLQISGVSHLLTASNLLRNAEFERTLYIVKGAGTLPAFGHLYRDFGLFAFPLLFIAGVFFERSFVRSRLGTFNALFYAYLWGALVFSYQYSFFFDRAFLWNMFVMWMISRLSAQIAARSSKRRL